MCQSRAIATARVPTPILSGYFPICHTHEAQVQLLGSSSSLNLIEFSGHSHLSSQKVHQGPASTRHAYKEIGVATAQLKLISFFLFLASFTLYMENCSGYTFQDCRSSSQLRRSFAGLPGTLGPWFCHEDECSRFINELSAAARSRQVGRFTLSPCSQF